MFHYLKNLSSTEVFSGNPWEIEVTIPEKVREDKQERDKWINRPKTNHCVYSLWEGLNPKLRVSSKKGTSNPPAVCHGIAIDFDAVASEADRKKQLKRVPLPVFGIEHTLTKGHWRALIVFERPIRFVNEGMAKHFLSQLLKDWKLGGGIDKGAFLEPNRYWTSSGEFEIYGDKVPEKECLVLEAASARTYKFNEFSLSVNFSADELYKALCERYPDFPSKWEGTFDFEAQGPSFWVEGSESPKSAIIKQNGIYTFSAHADKPFYTWGELLGKDFVAKKEEAAFASIAETIYRTQKNFMVKMADGRWRPHDRADISNLLRVDFGLSQKIQDNGLSQIDQAIAYIRNHRRVDGSAPFIFNRNEVVRVGNKLVLNEIAQAEFVMQPSEEKAVWGPDGNMPWLSKFFDTFLLNKEEALPYLLAWLALFYRSGYYCKPQSGQVALIAGGVGVGKTFFNDVILGGIFGTPGDPASYLTGRDTFGAQLFHAPVWAINDGSVGSDFRTKKKYAELLKAAVANRMHPYHEKFMTPVEVVWVGRISISCNTDPHSLRAVTPDMDMSNQDKLMLFQTTKTPQADFLPQDGHMDQVRRELPIFCRFLLDFEIPEELKAQGTSANRFGVKAYHDPELLEKIMSTSAASTMWEMVVVMLEDENLFKDGKKSVAHVDFPEPDFMALLQTRFPGAFGGGSSPAYVRQQLEMVAEQHHELERLTGPRGTTIWRLYRD